MAHLRRLTQADIPDCRALWKQRFGDSEPFLDWYFAERFAPELSTCVQVDDLIVSMAHGRKMRLRFGTEMVSALMVSGVCTRPEFERRGYMRAVIWSIGKIAQEAGCSMLFQKPVDPAIYTGLGFTVCTEAQYCQGGNTAAFSTDPRPDVNKLLDCYTAAGANYGYFPMRDETDMLLRIRDLQSDGAQLICVRNAVGEIDGYAFYNPEALLADEVLARNHAAYGRLLAALPADAIVKLPPDLPFGGTLRPHMMMLPLDDTPLPACAETLTGYCPEEY